MILCQVLPPPPLAAQDELGCDSAHILAQKLIYLELQSKAPECSELKRAALDPNLILTPPHTPNMMDPGEAGTTDGETVLPSAAVAEGVVRVILA